MPRLVPNRAPATGGESRTPWQPGQRSVAGNDDELGGKEIFDQGFGIASAVLDWYLRPALAKRANRILAPFQGAPDRHTRAVEPEVLARAGMKEEGIPVLLVDEDPIRDSHLRHVVQRLYGMASVTTNPRGMHMAVVGEAYEAPKLTAFGTIEEWTKQDLDIEISIVIG